MSKVKSKKTKPKTKKKSKRPAWQWWTTKDLERRARVNVMKRPRSAGIGKRRIKSEIREEIKRLVKKWKRTGDTSPTSHKEVMQDYKYNATFRR